MKKKILFILLVGVFLLSGCGKTSESSIIKDLEKKINNSKSYYIEGTLEIVNNEDLYTYDVKVSYAKGDNYKVNLTNKVNNHEQVILRNSDGVYVVTPRINKSFNFKVIGLIIIHKFIYLNHYLMIFWVMKIEHLLKMVTIIR